MSYPLPGAGRPAGHGQMLARTAAGPAQDSPGAASVTGVFRAHHAELVRLAVLLLGDRPSAGHVVQDLFAPLCGRDLLPAGDGALAFG
jgi:hypothetical protein